MLDLSDDVARFKKLGGAWSVARHVHDALRNMRAWRLMCSYFVRMLFM